MSVHVLVQGAIYGPPKAQNARNGNPFVTFAVRVQTGGESAFWRILVFGETAREQAAALRDGDAVAVRGVPRFDIYAPPGKAARVSLSVMAEGILPLKAPPRERKPKSKPSPPATDAESPAEHYAANPFDDQIPF